MELIYVGVLLANIYFLLDSVEIIRNFPNYELKGLMTINRVRTQSISNIFLRKLVSFRHNKKIAYLRLVLSVLGIACIGMDHYYWIILLFLFIIELHFRFIFIDSVAGANGIIIYNIFIFFLYFCFKDPRILHLITAHLVLAYVSNGIKKIRSAKWRNGSGLMYLIKTDLFGSPFINGIIKDNRTIYWLLSWGIMLFQASFFLSLTHEKLLYAYIVMGIIFHLSIAFAFKLYDFLISFISSYPILIYTFYYLSDSM